MTDAELRELLRRRGRRVTSQRLLVHRALRDHGGHLSAEQVLELVGPGLSQQTVYSALQVLVELGAARRVAVPGGSARFEARLDDHHHALCGSCGRITDLDAAVATAPAVDAAVRAGFAPDGAAVTVLGRCPACRPSG